MFMLALILALISGSRILLFENEIIQPENSKICIFLKVIGEYSYLATHCDAEDVMEQLCTLFDRKHYGLYQTKLLSVVKV